MTAWRAHVTVDRGNFRLDVAIEGSGGPVAVIGPNGSGKTTFLRAIVGAITVNEAEIVVDDHVLARTRTGHHLPMEARGVGYVPQGYGLFPHLSAVDNVAFGLSAPPFRLSPAARRQRARTLLGALGCAEVAERRLPQLSGGERQRVALARALAREPKMLLLDEPMAALDVGHRRMVRQWLAERLTAYGGASVLVTHDVRDVAVLGAQVWVLEQGRVVQRGTLSELQASPATPFVAEFVER